MCLGDLKHESKHSDSKQAKISDTAEVAPDFTKASAESKHEDVINVIDMQMLLI